MQEAEQALARFMPQVKELLGKNLSLERIEPLMAALGHPEKKLRIIHVAGTSGKTSTTYYISSLLIQAGLRVGTTVSPHVDSVTERSQVDLQPLDEATFCYELGLFLDLISSLTPQPTYYELLIAFVYWYFAKIQVDYAVIETGLGGLHDATNVATNPDKLCVITDIGLDHTHILGDTVPEIAGQKAGIIHPGNAALIYAQAPEVMAVFKRVCDEQHATLMLVEERHTVSDLPQFQRRNFHLAEAAYNQLASRDGLPKLTVGQLDAAAHVHIPGRMEYVKLAGKSIVMDGAHNPQKMQALVSSFQERYPGKKIAVLVSAKQNKDTAAMLATLRPICRKLIITSFAGLQDIGHQSEAVEVLADRARNVGFLEVAVIPNSHEAFAELMKGIDDLVLITGSIYLLSKIRSEERLA